VNVFWNREERRLRALWRLLGQVALAVAAAAVPILAVAEPLAWLHRRGIFLPTLSREACDAAINMIVGPLITVAVIGSVTLGLRWLERRSWDAYGVRMDGRGWGWLAGGFLLGAALLTGIFAVELALGWISVAGFLVANAGSAVGLGLAHALVKDLCVGIYEEVISRGVLLRNLSDGLGTPAGVLVSSSIASPPRSRARLHHPLLEEPARKASRRALSSSSSRRTARGSLENGFGTTRSSS